jgi:hypothetical protein
MKLMGLELRGSARRITGAAAAAVWRYTPSVIF